MADPEKILVYVQLGNMLLRVSALTLGKLHELFDGQDGTDEAILAKLDKEYAERIKRAEAAAGVQ